MENTNFPSLQSPNPLTPCFCFWSFVRCFATQFWPMRLAIAHPHLVCLRLICLPAGPHQSVLRPGGGSFHARLWGQASGSYQFSGSCHLSESRYIWWVTQLPIIADHNGGGSGSGSNGKLPWFWVKEEAGVAHITLTVSKREVVNTKYFTWETQMLKTYNPSSPYLDSDYEIQEVCDIHKLAISSWFVRCLVFSHL